LNARVAWGKLLGTQMFDDPRRTTMRALLCTVTAAVLALSLALAAGGAEEGWINLFDGKSMDGWKASENTSSWKVEGGAFVCHGPRSHLYYVGPHAPFTNFEFKADVLTKPKSNSGIYIHTRYQDKDWPKWGYEVQVNNTHSDPKKTGGLYGVADVYQAPAQDDKWFEMHITVQGKHVLIKVDGKTVVDYTEPEKPPVTERFQRALGKGTFALQAHDPVSEVHFKNIRVKKL
jgi:hypothetical protein